MSSTDGAGAKSDKKTKITKKSKKKAEEPTPTKPTELNLKITEGFGSSTATTNSGPPTVKLKKRVVADETKFKKEISKKAEKLAQDEKTTKTELAAKKKQYQDENG